MNKKTSFLYDVKKITLLGSLAFLGACNHMEPLEGQASSKRSTSRLVDMDRAEAARQELDEAKSLKTEIERHKARINEEINFLETAIENLNNQLGAIDVSAETLVALVRYRRHLLSKLTTDTSQLDKKIEELNDVLKALLDNKGDGKVTVTNPDGITKDKDIKDLTDEEWAKIINERVNKLKDLVNKEKEVLKELKGAKLGDFSLLDQTKAIDAETDKLKGLKFSEPNQKELDAAKTWLNSLKKKEAAGDDDNGVV